MSKFLLMSVLLVTFLIPLRAAARAPNLRQGLRLVQKQFLVFCVVYVITILYVLPRL
jgi:hypothetical protein